MIREENAEWLNFSQRTKGNLKSKKTCNPVAAFKDKKVIYISLRLYLR
jgi:hypothetical protein